MDDTKPGADNPLPSVVSGPIRDSWLAASTDQLLTDCRVTHTRRQGPGGQHRNKVSTAVVLEHRPSGIRVEASERRSQRDNLREAARRLRRAIARECRSAVNVASYQPTSTWVRRCQAGRVSVSTDHDDYAPLLAEALDVLAVCQWRPSAAAELLGCTTSQLVRLVQQDPAAIAGLNRWRGEAGLEPLK